MSGERRRHLGRRRCGRAFGAPPFVVKHRGLHHKAWRAEAALQRVARDERLLHRMQIGGRCDSLDGHHLFAARGVGGHQATHHRLAVEEHRAGAAYTGAANELGAGEPGIAQDVDEHGVIVGDACGHRDRLAIHDHVHRLYSSQSSTSVTSRCSNTSAAPMVRK